MCRQAGGENVMTVSGGAKGVEKKKTWRMQQVFHALECETVTLSERQKLAWRKMLSFSLRGTTMERIKNEKHNHIDTE